MSDGESGEGGFDEFDLLVGMEGGGFEECDSDTDDDDAGSSKSLMSAVKSFCNAVEQGVLLMDPTLLLAAEASPQTAAPHLVSMAQLFVSGEFAQAIATSAFIKNCNAASSD